MNVQIIQSDLEWEDPAANRARFTDIITGMSGRADLVVLPEMFTTGFSMNSALLAESMSGESVSWMRETALSEHCALTGSLIVKEKNNYYNRMVFVMPSGQVVTYDKRHLFRMGEENNFFTPGTTPVIVDYCGFKINMQVCYDLRFPVWSRCVNNNYHAIIYVANWPESRRGVWKSLLVARAIENQCYVIGANRVGKDGKGRSYAGDSVIIGPKGNTIAEIEPYSEGVTGSILSVDELKQFRDKFPVWRDADNFTLSR